MAWLLAPLAPTFEAALRDVRARALEARVAAADRLAEIDVEAERENGRAKLALEGLLALARDPDARVRAAALRGLRQLGADEALECVLERLDDGDALVRELAVVALGALGGTRARAALARALRSAQPEVRFQAVACYLEACEPEEATAALALLRDEDPKVRANAARGFTRFVALVRDELRQALDDGFAIVRDEAAIALGRNGDASGWRQLAEALEDPEYAVEALDVIGEIELSALRPEVAAIAQSVLRPLGLKVAAARALIRLGDDLGDAVLREVLRAFRNDGRNYAVQVVGELKRHALAGELVRLTRWRRGTQLETLIVALSELAPASAEARAGLGRLARLSGANGELARRALEAAG